MLFIIIIITIIYIKSVYSHKRKGLNAHIGSKSTPNNTKYVKQTKR